MLCVLRDLFGWLCRHLTDIYPELAGQFYPLPVSARGCGRGCPCGALSEELA